MQIGGTTIPRPPPPRRGRRIPRKNPYLVWSCARVHIYRTKAAGREKFLKNPKKIVKILSKLLDGFFTKCYDKEAVSRGGLLFCEVRPAFAGFPQIDNCIAKNGVISRWGCAEARGRREMKRKYVRQSEFLEAYAERHA